MNKEEFIEELKNQTNYDKQKCIIINDILENNFLIGNNNKQKILAELKENLSITDQESEEIYNFSINIITKKLKDKIKHPFKSQD